MNVRHPMGVLHSFSIKNIYDKKWTKKSLWKTNHGMHTNSKNGKLEHKEMFPNEQK